MLSDYVGEGVFLKGVSIYLKKHLYGNTVSEDLWDGISEAAAHDVGKMMKTWVGKVRRWIYSHRGPTNIRQSRWAFRT
jgi:aminopeptidase 2